MKKLLILFLLKPIFANTIILQNCNQTELNLSSIPKRYYNQLYVKAPLDKKIHHYTGIKLKDFANLIKAKNKIKFIAYDDYVVTFDKNEINSNYIYFAFLENNKPIPLSKRGPAKIIYTKKDNNKDYFFKSIFLIKKVICE